MKLDAFLNDYPGGAEAFASRVGLSTASLSRIRRGGQNISRDTIRSIVEESQGAVTAEELVFPERHGLANNGDGAATSTGQADEESGEFRTHGTESAVDDELVETAREKAA